MQAFINSTTNHDISEVVVDDPRKKKGGEELKQDSNDVQKYQHVNDESTIIQNHENNGKVFVNNDENDESELSEGEVNIEELKQLEKNYNA